MDSFEKELPNAPDAERAIVGAFLVNPNLAYDNIASLHNNDFYNTTHRIIIAALREMIDSGEEVDLVLLMEHLRAKGVSNITSSLLNDLTYGMPTQLRLDRYIKQVKEKASLRAYLKAAGELIARIKDGGEALEDVVIWARASFDELEEQISVLNSPLITSFAEFMKHKYTDGESIAFHAGRGEIGFIQGITNRGKTTFSRNAALTLATGGHFLSVVAKGEPRKVLLLNFEGAGARFQHDLEVMTKDFTSDELELVRTNLFPVHAPIINGEPLTLSRHMSQVLASARRIQPDVMIIDTAGAAFDIRNENDNAEIQHIMKTLIRITRRLNCLIVLIHHIGKAKLEEGAIREAAHRGRGASSWADFATSIFNLEVVKDDPDLLILECAKRKDGENYDCLLTLNRQARWFSISEQVIQRTRTSYELVVDAVKSFNQEVKRVQINEALSGKIGQATITRCLNEAVSKGDIIKTGHGLYQFNGNAQMIISYSDDHLSISEEVSESDSFEQESN